MTAQVSIRPSEGRRAALRKAEGEINVEVSNFFPIERYYDGADKVLHSFLKAYDEKRLDDAYVLGKRFATFSLEGLPKHDYYRSPKYASLQKKNNQQLQLVISKLEQVCLWMDEEEAEKERLRQEYRKRVQAEQERIQQERVRKQQEIEEKRYKELQERVEQQRKKTQRGGTANVEQSAMNKLQMLRKTSSSRQTSNTSLTSQLSDMDIDRKSTGSIHYSPPERPEQAPARSSRRSRWQQEEQASGIDAPGSHMGGEEALPPPIPPPVETPPPPSYSQALAEHDKLLPPPTNGQPLSNAPVQRTVTAPAGGAILRMDSDLISFPEPPSEEILPPPPYCECSIACSSLHVVVCCT